MAGKRGSAKTRPLLLAVVLGSWVIGSTVASAAEVRLLNVSYDVSRGTYEALNAAFIADRQAHGDPTVAIDQSHGGSSAQARAVIDGLAADVVTMNSPLDIDAIAKAGLLSADWATRLPEHSSPSWSVIVFVVRAGNPKKIRDWKDLIAPNVAITVPNPKTSGNGRYSYLAAWQFARSRTGASDADALTFERQLFSHVPVLDSGGRGATTSFTQRGVGDVLLTFENEAALIIKSFPGQYALVRPSVTVRADNPVAVVDANVARKHSAAQAADYLKFHYSPTAQEIFAENDLRPIDAKVLAAHAAQLPAVDAFSVEQVYGSWAEAFRRHFADGASFDQIIAQRSPAS